MFHPSVFFPSIDLVYLVTACPLSWPLPHHRPKLSSTRTELDPILHF